MALFCVIMKIYSVSHLRCPFRSHFDVFLSEISPVCCLKYPYSYFSSHFSFLVIVLLIPMLSGLFLVAVISLSLLFLCNPRADLSIFDAIFNAGESSSCFTLTHIVCLCHLLDVRPYASSWVSLFSGLFVEVLPTFSLKMVPSIFRRQPRCLSLW